jgi:hypothetical protein
LLRPGIVSESPLVQTESSEQIDFDDSVDMDIENFLLDSPDDIDHDVEPETF